MSIGFIGGGQMCTCIILFNINNSINWWNNKIKYIFTK